MPKSEKKSIFAMDLWQSERLRLTTFPEPSINTQETKWWEKIVGEPPESTTIRQRLGELHEEGVFESGTLSLDIQPLRIDWNMSVAKPTEPPERELQTLGSFLQTSDTFVRFMKRWLENDCPDLGRIAFGAVLLMHVKSREDGYNTLAQLLSNVKLDPENTSDFMYQINRPRKSKLHISDLHINRLSKWSVGAINYALFRLEAGKFDTKQLYTAPETFTCRLELDINTPADYQSVLPRNKLGSIFDELIKLAKEIAVKGDIP